MGGSTSKLVNKQFSTEQIYALKCFFKDIASRKGIDHLDKDLFLRVFKLPGILGERLFSVFDSNNDNQVDLNEFLCGLSVVIHGSKQSKIKFLFKMYDLNQDGLVTKADLSTMLLSVVNGGLSILYNHKHAENKNFEGEKENDSRLESESFIEKLVESAFINKNDESLNIDEFTKFVENNEQLLEILDDAFVFEDFTSEEEMRCLERTVSQEFSFHKTSKASKRKKSDLRENFKFFLESNCDKETCFLGDIITPDSVKLRHKPTPKRSNMIGEQLEWRCGDKSMPLDLIHAFEQMHHFHHGANHGGEVFKEGKNFHFLNKRYFVLRESFLYVFRKKQSLSPLKSIWMKDCCVRAVDHGGKGKKRKFGVEISYPCDNKKKGYIKTFYTSQEHEQQKWVSVLKLASESKDFHSTYDVKHKIGIGKFSSVHSCVDKKTDREYAVKIIDRLHMSDRERESLRLELSILKLLHHPNVSQICNVYEEKDTVFIVMNYYKGGDLFERVKNNGTLSEDKAKSVMWRILDAIRYIHSLGIVHRDLKPENILLCFEDSDIHVAVADFGLSDFLGPDTHLSMPCGTLSYVAPEVFGDDGYGKEIDLWSLGVILYVILRGSLPFSGKNKKSIATKIMSHKLTFNSPKWDKISPEAKDLITKLLVVDPAKRLTEYEAMRHPWFTTNEANSL